MKLELKHLAPYLPYGLKVYWDNKEYELNSLKTNNRCQVYCEIQDEIYGVLLKHIKPILRPLPEFCPDEEIDTPESLQTCCYSYVQNLISQHYDVFGLIEQGLAIDINELNK